MTAVINDRFGNFLRISGSNLELILATATLPKFKNYFVDNDSEKHLIYQMLKTECYKVIEETSVSEAEIETHSNVDYDDDFYVQFHQPTSNRRVSIESEIELEVANYFNDSRRDDAILENYKNIKMVYLKYNTTLSASAAIERVYSQSALIFRPHRNRINAENFERTLLLKYNRKFING